MVKLYFSFLEKQRIGPGTSAGMSRRLARPHEKAAFDAIKQVLSATRLPAGLRDDVMLRYLIKHDDAVKKQEAKPAGKEEKP